MCDQEKGNGRDHGEYQIAPIVTSSFDFIGVRATSSIEAISTDRRIDIARERVAARRRAADVLARPTLAGLATVARHTGRILRAATGSASGSALWRDGTFARDDS